MLSILIPVYNYDVTDLLQNLHKQCTKLNIPFEIVLCDDKSETNYIHINKTQADLLNCRFIENDTNKGRTQTRKLLAETATYNNLLFLDSDVLPVSDDFIKNYIEVFYKAPVIFGGYAYCEKYYSAQNSLRYWYGKKREEKTANQRKLTPYATIFSGNLLIEKKTFLKNNYRENSNFYGLDNLFAYNLFKSRTHIIHIDNPIFHIGLENNEIFFRKCLESVEVRKKLLTDAPGIERINSLLKHYKILKKYKLNWIIKFAFKLTEPFIKKRIFSENPNLFCLDLYRLGYICSI